MLVKLKKAGVFAVVMGAFLASGVAMESDQTIWPDNKEVAVVLTYDDTLDSQLDTVIPQLDKAGFLATFYPSIGSGLMQERLSEWRAAAAKGHELGNHMLFHPCRKSNPDREWVADYYDMDTYSLEQFENELRLSNIALHAIDGKTKRTFAYTCGDTTVANDVSVIPAVQAHAIAARSGTGRPAGEISERYNGIDDPLKMDRYMIKSIDVSNLSGQQLIELVQSARSSKGVVTLLFHGVALEPDEYLLVSPSAHQQLVDYLQQNQDIYWVTPLQGVIDLLDTRAGL